MRRLTLLIILISHGLVKSQHDPHFYPNRTTIVHMFEWKFDDIAAECENILGPLGYGAVQVSPITENAIIEPRPWWERYQPISYLIASRSGNEEEFEEMVKRCHSAKVVVYVDVVLNHMARHHNRVIGTGGSHADTATKSFPMVPYTVHDFHPTCAIRSYHNAAEVRNCQLEGYLDLDQSKPYVQDQLADFLNKLIKVGVAGFRIDAAKHMWPRDLADIYRKIDDLNPSFGFPHKAHPFIYQEVKDLGTEAVKKTEYNALGVVTEFRYAIELAKIFRKKSPLKVLKNWGHEFNFLPSRDALAFVDSYDTQRGRGPIVLTHQNRREYIMAVGFMLAHPYSIPRVMSSYKFQTPDQGPPMDHNDNIISPKFDKNGHCKNGWICEHRWKEIINMMVFRNKVKEAPVAGWWDNGSNQIAFCRKGHGFIAINNEETDMEATLQTCLPQGSYCNVITGVSDGTSCTGDSVDVDSDGMASIKVGKEIGILAIHFGEKLLS